jgi:hypothetical protein
MNNSPYLDRPFLPLAVALPRLLEEVGVELTTARPAEAPLIRQRAHLILDLLRGNRRSRCNIERAAGSDRSSLEWGGLAGGVRGWV